MCDGNKLCTPLLDVNESPPLVVVDIEDWPFASPFSVVVSSFVGSISHSVATSIENVLGTSLSGNGARRYLGDNAFDLQFNLMANAKNTG